MKKRILAILVSTVAFSCFASAAHAQSAQGGSIKIRKNALEKTTWFHAPLQIDIIEDGPIVHDHRTGPSAAQSFQIPIGPLGTAGNDGVESLLPGGIPVTAGSVGYRTKSPLMSGRPALPAARFLSNITRRPEIVAHNLPSGASTNLLGKMSKPVPAPHVPRYTLLAAPAHVPAPVIERYSELPAQHAAGSSTVKTTTSVFGQIKRGNLLSGQ